MIQEVLLKVGMQLVRSLIVMEPLIHLYMIVAPLFAAVNLHFFTKFNEGVNLNKT